MKGIECPIMSYQVLARKLRPATFDAMVGQEHVVRALRHALDQGRLHHAYLFTGTRGVGKTTIARVLAKALNCETGITSNPCGRCSVCLEVADNRFIDLIEVDAASRTRVDDTRELLDNAQYLPSRGRYKVYLVDEVHMLSGASFNALLKTLEEPPAHVVFLLATTDPKKVPVTVLSRCLQFQLKNLQPARIASYLGGVLADEGVAAESAALDRIAEAARGSMRDALSITDQAIAFGQGAITAADVADMLGLVGRDAVAGLLAALARQDAAALLALSAELAERSADFADVLAELIAALHRQAVSAALGDAVAPPDAHASFGAEEIQLLYQIALLGLRDLPIAPDPRCGFEMTLLRMLAFIPVTGGPAPARASGASGSAPARASAPRASLATSPAPIRARATALPAGLSASASVPAASASASPRAQLSAVPAVSALANPDVWCDKVSKLTLAGVARMLAQHSELIEADAGAYVLRLDRRHEMLLADGPVAALERALADVDQREVSVRLLVGDIETETPAARQATERAAALAAARDLLTGDERVRALLEAFDGTLEDVRPVDRP
ncbi:MAG: DNA polymerase III subunit gamma/tau [Gammaproteobacteria bacterium]